MSERIVGLLYPRLLAAGYGLRPICVSASRLSLRAAALIVRGSQVRERVQQIAVRPNLISCRLSVCEHGEYHVDFIVGQCAAIVRKARRSARVIRKDVWQQRSRHTYCLLRRIAARASQFVREYANEAIIIRWLPVEVCLPLLSGEEHRLQWSSTPICLDPAFSSSVQRASPKPHPIGPQSRVG